MRSAPAMRSWAWYPLLAVTPFLLGWLSETPALCMAGQAAFGAAYLGWCLRQPQARARFALMLAGQAALQCTTRLGFLVALSFATSASPAGAAGAVLGPIGAALLLLLPQWAIAIAWWRALRLVRAGQPLAPYAPEEWTLPSSPAQVRTLLALRLDRLRAPDGPRLPRLLYASPLRARLLAEDSTQSQHVLWWPALPVAAHLHLAAEGHGTALTLSYRLRGGLHRLEWFAHPGSVLPLARFLHTHLVEPLREQVARQAAQQRQEQLRQQAVEAQLRVLQAQIEPHFFFNSLANLRHLYRSDIQAGERMLDHLIGYLRGAMQDLRAHESTVAHEFDLAAHYLAIMQVRFGERLAFHFTAQENAQALRFPPAMLVSLVENALQHGLRDHPAGQVRIAARIDGAQLRVSVTDNGPGWSSVTGTGTGLSNIRQRLEAMYGPAASLELGAPAAGGFEACIILPLDALTN